MAKADRARRRRGGDVPLARRVVIARCWRRLEVLGGQGLGQAGEVLRGDELEPLARGRDGKRRDDVARHLDCGVVFTGLSLAQDDGGECIEVYGFFQRGKRSASAVFICITNGEPLLTSRW